jgi:uncharacterized protein YukJ
MCRIARLSHHSDGDTTPHLQIRLLDSTGQPWRIAVNVQSDTGAEVVYWLVDPLLGHPILGELPNLPTGFHSSAPSSAGALDYVRAPLFDWQEGTALPASGSASADDLQDLLGLYLQHCQDAGGEVYAFGERFDRNLNKPIDVDFGNTDGLHGVHDIHLNQGNTGPHSRDNGARHDGGRCGSCDGWTRRAPAPSRAQRRCLMGDLAETSDLDPVRRWQAADLAELVPGTSVAEWRRTLAPRLVAARARRIADIVASVPEDVIRKSSIEGKASLMSAATRTARGR